MFRFLYRLAGHFLFFCATVCAATCALATFRASTATILKFGGTAAVFFILAMCAYYAARPRQVQ